MTGPSDPTAPGPSTPEEPRPHAGQTPGQTPGQTSGQTSRQTPLQKADDGHQRLEEARMWNVVSYLITGPAMFGLIGWGLDAWLGTTWLVAVGIVGGMALSLYLVWFRYGTQ
ncbi:hypothetical protein SAMN05216199_0962 [Pedococcus cremeus]|uniref:AtpZ/AtpI family protein n=1 Tax=Pedococcus cremeus TaxID=587636 RepID=A0A1H9RFM6_9MICO|nr:AtpZ/AtpI family protein [Pedococcus cremeus]SER71474.1 hypothetical protein SAMN05216199_0962 [Pedococcus cremeus]